MARPSIFSNDYEQRMRKRKRKRIINIILAGLIVACAAFFWGGEYIDKFGSGIGKYIKNNIALVKKDKGNTENTKNQDKGQSSQEQGNQTQEGSTQAQPPASSYFEYKSPGNRIYDIEYTENGSTKEITGIKNAPQTVYYDISADKQKIVFCDTLEGDILVGNTSGQVIKVSSDSYYSKTAAITLTKQSVMQKNPGYIWAAMPHFTSDNRIVYLTYLPYINKSGMLYMWSVGLQGSGSTMVGQNLANNLTAISYDGFDSDGSLRIKINNVLHYLTKGSSWLK